MYADQIKTEDTSPLNVTSTAFVNKEMIPEKYTVDGVNVNPPLTIENIPGNAISMTIMAEDIDAPGSECNHWVIWNIPPIPDIPEGHVPGVAGLNAFQHHCYNGPNSNLKKHRYVFKVYALDTNLRMQRISGKYDVEKAMKNHVLGYGELMGVYRQTKKNTIRYKKPIHMASPFCN